MLDVGRADALGRAVNDNVPFLQKRIETAGDLSPASVMVRTASSEAP